MVSTDTITRNSDGTYTSEYGYSISKAPNGQLWSGGAPTGYRDIGFGIQRTPSAWETYQPTTLKPQAAYVTPAARSHSGGFAGTGYTPIARVPDEGSILILAIYPWMLLLACLAYGAVSAPAALLPPGLHLHPAYGVAAFLGTIWLYRQMMAFLPTACLLALPAALGSGVIAWAISDGATLQRFVESSMNGSRPWAAAQALWPHINGWMIAATLVSLIVHLAYWRYRRVKVRRTGWIFSRSPIATAQELFAIALAAGAIGWGIAWLWPSA